MQLAAQQPALPPDLPSFLITLSACCLAPCAAFFTSFPHTYATLCTPSCLPGRYVPLGMQGWFANRGVSNVVELDWWQQVAHPSSSVQVALTPAQHWSMRSPLSRKASLWGGYAVLGANT